MITNSNTICIIADDLTGATDTSLQFHLRGAKTQILLNNDVDLSNISGTAVFAVSTESRNVTPNEAYGKVKETTQRISETINPDHFVKKIDSTIRGNIAVEVLGMLEVLKWDASVVVPAFPREGRITVGGYHLLKGSPIERTEMARDPHSPIFESHVPTLLKSQLPPNCEDLIGYINLSTIMKGAGPILREMNTLVKNGKKIIVADAVSNVDIEQLVLAVSKSDYQILPTGTAALAKALSNIWVAENEEEKQPLEMPLLPKLIVSGSATQINANQIDKLQQSKVFDGRISFIELDLLTVLDGVKDELVNQIAENLGENNIVVVHTSNLIKKFDGFSDESLRKEVTKAALTGEITDFLADLTKRVLQRKKVILITLGGETSYKCCASIQANQLTLQDEVAPAIALSQDNNDQLIVTKSGNLGNANTLIDILNYFKS